MVVSSHKSDVDVGQLRSSPIYGIKPIYETPQKLEVSTIEDDPTNPGAVTDSLRYERRAPNIRDSLDIIGGIVYPIVVCQHTDEKKNADGKYIILDGHGRIDQIRRRNEPNIWALVYRPLNLEQRICLRQTLGAAQEPFDAISIMKDLAVLAKQRNLDISSVEDVEVLLRDMPEKVRNYRKDLLMLTRWDLDSAAVLGESYSKNAKTIGIDKIRGMTRIVDAVRNHHPQLYEELGGDKGTTKRLADMYVAKKFSTGTRSQEAIRKVTSAVRELDEDQPIVRRFFKEGLDQAVLAPYAKTKEDASRDLPTLCQELAHMLIVASPEDFSDAERRALSNLNTMITGLL